MVQALLYFTSLYFCHLFHFRFVRFPLIGVGLLLSLNISHVHSAEGLDQLQLARLLAIINYSHISVLHKLDNSRLSLVDHFHEHNVIYPSTLKMEYGNNNDVTGFEDLSPEDIKNIRQKAYSKAVKQFKEMLESDWGIDSIKVEFVFIGKEN